MTFSTHGGKRCRRTTVAGRLELFLAAWLLIPSLAHIGSATAQTAPVLEWVEQAGGAGPDFPRGIRLSPSGEIVIAGGINTFDGELYVGDPTFGSITLSGLGLGDIFVAAYAPDGNAQWARLLGGEEFEGVTGFDLDREGRIYLTGYFRDHTMLGSTKLMSPGAGFDGFVAMSDQSGEIGWVHQMSGPDWTGAGDVSVDVQGNVYTTGPFEGTVRIGTHTFTSRGESDLYLFRSGAAGAVQWAAQIGGEGYEQYGSCVTTDGSGHVIVVGAFQSTAQFGPGKELTSRGAYDVFVSKYTPAGELVWVVSSGTNSDDWPNDCRANDAGEIFVAGMERGLAFISKYLPDGSRAWQRRDVGAGESDAWGITFDAEGNVYATGRFKFSVDFGQNTFGSGNDHLFLLGLAQSGEFRWMHQLGGYSGSVYGHAVAADEKGNVYVAGSMKARLIVGSTVYTTRGPSDILLLKYGSGGGAVSADDASAVPEQYALEQNYPNPFNPQTAIRFSLPSALPVRVSIYDPLGREVDVLLDGAMPAGRHEVTWEAADRPSGMYSYRIQAGSFTQTKQMLLLR